MLDVRSMRYFLRVAEHKSVSKAATSLYIAQPAVSRQIKKLEDDIGVQLFVRSGRGVELTDAGALLEQHVKDVLDQLSNIHAEVAACVDEPRGTVSLAVSPAAGQILAPPLIREMKKRCPKVSLKIAESFTGVIREELRAKRCDLGVLHDPEDDRYLEKETLLYEELFVIGPTDARDDEQPRENYSAKEIEDLPLILPAVPNQLRILADEIAATHKLSLNIVAEIDSIPIMKALVEEGFGYTLLSFGSVHDEVARGVLTATPVVKPSAQRKLVVAWNSEQRLTNAARQTIVVLREIASSMIKQGKWRGSL